MVADIGLIGLAVMGKNLVLNIVDKGYKVTVFNRTVSKIDEFIIESNEDKNIIRSSSIQEFISNLKLPRKIMLMVKSGAPVDKIINLLLPHLDKGDIIIDGGNSNFHDTIRRFNNLKTKKILFLGLGISGGEEGARYGPSIMPGGSKDAWEKTKDIFQSIAAKLDDGTPCCSWIGENGAGHYVKMIHNGIEYGDMQLISEAYHIMYQGLQMHPYEISNVFHRWNKGRLNSYLIEITAEILQKRDEIDNEPLILKILDKAGQKGTGKWAVVDGLELGIPVSLISVSVFQRYLSSQKNNRITLSNVYNRIKYANKNDNKLNKEIIINKLELALYASKLISYSQGFLLLNAAGCKYSWDLNLGNIALMWRGGCIIRSKFLENITDAFNNDAKLSNLLLAKYFKEQIIECESPWREIVMKSIEFGIPIPGFASALTYFDGFRTKTLPANLIQAQRDYFGAHGYERIDQPIGKIFHTNWKISEEN